MYSIKPVFVNIVIVYIINAEYYNNGNPASVFEFFKKKYHKKYSNRQDEKEAYGNFIENFNKVNDLNENPNDKDTIYSLNKYADIDPIDLEEHFALNVTAYDANKIYRGPRIRDRHVLRNKNGPQPERGDLESMELYDLDDADDLYKQYLAAFGKNFTKKYDRTVHFYRFVKSLVEVNRQHYLGNKDRVIDRNADVVKRPDDYSY